MNETPTQTQNPTKGLARKLVGVTLFAVLVFGLISFYSDASQLRTNLATYRWSAFATALVLSTLNYLIRFVRWEYYLRILDVQVPRGESFLVFLSGFVMSLTPGKVGEVFKSYLLAESRGVAMTRTAPIVVAERLTDLIALVLLIAIGGASLQAGPMITLASAGLVGSIVLICVWRPAAMFALSIGERLPLFRRVVPKAHQAYDSLYAMTRPLPMLTATVLATLGWSIEAAGLYAIVGGFDIHSIGLQLSLFAYAASTLAGALAMMPGGLGVTEAGMVGVLLWLAGKTMHKSQATGAMMLMRLSTLWWAFLLGLLSLGLWRLHRRRAHINSQQRT